MDLLSGCAVVFATEDTAMAAKARHVLVVENGTVVEEGEPLELLNRPGTRLHRLADANLAHHSNAVLPTTN